MRSLSSFTRHSFGVRNRGPWRSIFSHSLHQFHENDLFTSAAAMSYFGLMTLFPALLLMLALSNNITAANELINRAIDVYPGSRVFLRETLRSFSSVSTGVLVSCFIVVLWAGSWVFAVIERALNRIWGATSRAFWHGRALTVGMIGIIGLLLALSVGITSVVVALRQMAGNLSPRQMARYPILLSAGSVFFGKASTRCSFLVTGLLFVGFIVSCQRQVVAARYLAGCGARRFCYGKLPVCFCVELELLSLRSNLRLRWRSRRVFPGVMFPA